MGNRDRRDLHDAASFSARLMQCGHARICPRL
jgi:hypothetical protein